MARIERIQIPNTTLWVNAPTGQGNHFIQSFLDSVKRIPRNAQRVLDRYWSEFQPTFPMIALTPSRAIVSDDGQTGIAMTDHSGLVLTFSLPAIEAADTENRQCVIAHELSHAFAFAAYHYSLLEADELRAYRIAANNPEELVLQHEAFADLRLARWGFNPEKLRSWSGVYLQTPSS